MAGKAEQIKGRAKQAIGDLSGNKNLKAEGATDHRAGEVKAKVGKLEEKLDDAIDKVKDDVRKK
jgi:uncharacterized protein YjbJ (UPF0337 family)